MAVDKLMVKDIRNIESLSLHPSPEINVLHGLNGSGKTSVLEAIYLLGMARSFRSHKIKPVIRSGASQCTVYGLTAHQDSNQIHIGVTRNLQQDNALIRVSGRTLKSTSELAQLLPIQLINPDTFKLLEGAPQGRRQFLDWGVFHVKQRDYIPLWKRLQKSLKQRNSLLRHGRMSDSTLPKTERIKAELPFWNAELCKVSELVHQYRNVYFQELVPVFDQVLSELTDLKGINLSYTRGWDKERSYSEVLTEALERDLQAGYTQFGPQRADIRVKIDGVSAVDRLSRGQLKLVVSALKLSQAQLFSNSTGRQCLFLVDDLPSELDFPHRQAMCRILQTIKSQVFITCVEPSSLEGCWLPKAEVKMFHVKQGRLEANEQNLTGREIRQTESLEIDHE